MIPTPTWSKGLHVFHDSADNGSEGATMTILVELDPETEARLATQAARRGMAPEQFAVEFLRENLPVHDTGRARLTREGLRAMTRELQQGSENLPVLPPEATERASFYEDRE
jgi:hypothetical protein